MEALSRLFIFLLFSFGFVVKPHADDYGYIKVKVVKTNPSHKQSVQLRANSSPLGSAFSHKDESISWMSLSKSHLNPNGPETSLKASYKFNKMECSFEFDIYFSFARDMKSAIKLGRFSAPTQNQLNNLPIGLYCNDRKGEVCSNNASLQKQINHEKYLKRIAAYNVWKREYDKRIRTGAAENIKLVEKAQSQIDNLDTKVPESAPEHTDEEIERLLAEFLGMEDEDSRATNDRGQPDESKEISAEDAVEDVKAKQAVISLEDKKKLANNLYRTPGVVGTYMGAWVHMNNSVEEYLAFSRRQHEMMIAENLYGDAQERAIAELQIRQWESYRTNILHLEAPKTIAKDGIRFAFNDLFDFCEAITQREMCLPNGRELSKAEVAYSIIGIFLGGRKVNQKAAESIGLFKNDMVEELLASSKILGWKASKDAFEDLRLVIPSLRNGGKLPDNYISKQQAKALGWNSKKGNLAEIAPGKRLGGNKYHNRDDKLPAGEYFEADLGYRTGFRGNERIVYSLDGSRIFLTNNHYKTFTELK